VDCERTITYLCDGLYDDGDTIYYALEGLADDASSGAINVASVASVSKLRFDGFFDHAAADYIAGITRRTPNQDTDKLVSDCLGGIQCKPLLQSDLQWLGESGGAMGDLHLSSGSLARDREEGQARIQRLAERISSEFGFEPP